MALDYLYTLIRYRPFVVKKDLDPQAHGYLADTLQTGRFFVPAAHSLNDPWEATPALQSAWWRKDKHLELADFFAFLVPENRTPERFSKLLQELRLFSSEQVLDHAQQLLLSHFRDAPILSLSDRADIFLMWAYYGLGHNGYALVFDASKLPFATAVRVKYSKRRAQLLLVLRHLDGIAIDVLATKARQWSHEREWRVIPPSQPLQRQGFIDFQPAPPNGYHATVPMDSIVGVVVGDQLYKGPHSQDVMNLLESHAARFQFWLAEIDKREFKIVLRPIRFGSTSDREGSISSSTQTAYKTTDEQVSAIAGAASDIGPASRV